MFFIFGGIDKFSRYINIKMLLKITFMNGLSGITKQRITEIFLDFYDRTVYNINEQSNLLDLSALLL